MEDLSEKINKISIRIETLEFRYQKVYLNIALQRNLKKRIEVLKAYRANLAKIQTSSNNVL